MAGNSFKFRTLYVPEVPIGIFPITLSKKQNLLKRQPINCQKR